MMGGVYLIEDIENNAYKIGATRGNVEKRIKQLQTGSSSELKLKYLFETNYPFRLETMLHNRFKNLCMINEWYDLQKEDIDNFLETCRQLENVIISLKDNHFFSKGLK